MQILTTREYRMAFLLSPHFPPYFYRPTGVDRDALLKFFELAEQFAQRRAVEQLLLE